MSIDRLSGLYAAHKIYPQRCFTSGTPLRVFQNKFSDDHYALDLKTFLTRHDYNPDRRGADLPWWGKEYFAASPGKRVFVVAQDSLARDAGSMTFFAHLFAHIADRRAYYHYCDHHTDQLFNKPFQYGNWTEIRSLLSDRWGINLDFLFITDAAKVYRQNSWTQFDYKLSRALLCQEIKLCRPNVLILLGRSPLRLLRPDVEFASAVEEGQYIQVGGEQAILAPFPIGQGRAQPHFARRLETATALIRAAL